jgi:hypothetical protein
MEVHLLDMTNLVKEISSIYQCRRDRLHRYLTVPENLWHLADYLQEHYTFETVHLKQNKKVKFGGFTHCDTRHLFAYNGYLGVTVQQHIYSRHKIKLRYPHYPCVVGLGGNAHIEYFPIELIRVRERNR